MIILPRFASTLALLSLALFGTNYQPVSAQTETPQTNTTTISPNMVGDFVIESPTKNDLIFKIGDTMKIKWDQTPKNLPRPNNVTLELRYGVWPDVSKWYTIASEIPNNGSYDWKIPENQFVHKDYMLKISTLQTRPALIRDKVTDFRFSIILGTMIINGEIIWSNAASSMHSPIQLDAGAYIGLVSLILFNL